MIGNQPELLNRLAAAQNGDGGWGYKTGSSWTEPTAYALLALSTAGAQYQSSVRQGTDWLRRMRRPDGGWRPHPSVDQSTWVTAFALLLPNTPGGISIPPAAEWLMRQTAANSGWVFRLRQWMLGTDLGAKDSGWCWFPGTAAWVAPTAIAVLALRKRGPGQKPDRIAARVDEGRRFLLDRMCADGGWNHGSSRALGYDSGSYPEMTGLGLLAMNGVRSPQIAKAVAAAERHWSRCRSSEGQSWLRLGLLAQGRPDPLNQPSVEPCRTTSDLALSALANAARDGHNVFLHES